MAIRSAESSGNFVFIIKDPIIEAMIRDLIRGEDGAGNKLDFSDSLRLGIVDRYFIIDTLGNIFKTYMS